MYSVSSYVQYNTVRVHKYLHTDVCCPDRAQSGITYLPFTLEWDHTVLTVCPDEEKPNHAHPYFYVLIPP